MTSPRGSVLRRAFAVFLVLLAAPPSLLGQEIDVYQRPVRFERSRDYDAQHYRISLTFDLDRKYFEGENRIVLTPLKDEFLKCVLDAEELVVDAVTDQRNQPLQFEQTDRHLIVHFPRAYSYGEQVTFTVRYHATDPQYGLFFDEERPANPLMVSTVSWPENAHHWIPCYDFPNDKVTNELIVTVARGNKVLSNGALVGVTEDENKGTVTWHWSQELPHPTYLFMLAIGPFAVIEDSLGSLPVNYWVYEKDVQDAAWIFEKTPYMINYFNNLFQYQYPWAKYDQVTTPRQGGGAEATSATVLGQGIIHDRRAEQDFSWERVVAHEIAHQWWGDLITLRTWSHTWLNESFATYCDYLYTRFDKGEDEGAFDLLGKKNQYLREAHTEYIRPIVFDRYDRPQDNFDSHTYPKGAAVLHMLRFIMGDEPFFRTLSHFLHKYEFQSVDTHDFMISVKEVTGQNLDWFFEQFVFRPGHPVFDVGYSWDERSNTLRLRVAQLQDTSKRVPIYTIPVIIGIVTAEGRRSEKVWLRQQEELFEFNLPKKPLMVRFDEGNYLLKEWTFDKDVDELLYQLGSDDVIGRLWAISQLERSVDSSRVVNGLIDRACNDAFWAVRRGAVEMLGGLRRQEDIELFRDMSRDENSRVRTSAMRALGEYSRPDLLPFYRERFSLDDSYLARAEALRAIGICGDRSQIPFLEQAMKMSSPRNVLGNAAEWAIGEINKRYMLPAAL